MRAIILVGGEGTRLRPLTYNVPKAVVPVLNEPFLKHVLYYLKGHGVDQVILALGHQAEQIQSCFGGGSELGLKLIYLIEHSPLGTAGAVKNAEAFLDEPFFVFNGDIFTGIDLTAMMHQHRERRASVSIALVPVENPTIYGVVETDAGGRVKRFVEKPSWRQVTTNMINAGIYIVEPSVLKHIPPLTRFTFEHGLFPQLLELGEPIFNYPSDAYWIDIGAPQKYLKLNCDLLLGKEHSIFYQPDVNNGVNFKGESFVHSTAQIEGPLMIGENCVIERDVQLKGPAVLGMGCRLKQGAVVERAVLWEDIEMGGSAVLKNCVIGSHSRIEEAVSLDDCVVGENTIISKGSKLAYGLKAWSCGF